MQKHLKPAIATLVIAATVGAFIWYIKRHPATIDHLRYTPPLTVLVLLLLYGGLLLALVILAIGSLKVYAKRLGQQENILFNAYSLLVNFFGPGQSGVAFRGMYLKKKHNLGYKKYLFVTLVYYAFYAIISALMTFVGTRPWWQTVVLLLATIGGSWFVLRWYRKKSNKAASGASFTSRNLGIILGATALQLAVLTAIYFVELHSVDAHISLGQVLAYTGVANFALFVALTPGAIGIREAFLVFSQHLHGIDSTTIVAANIIDRGVYLLFLGLLFLLVIGTHAKDKLHVSQLKPGVKDEKTV